MRRAAMLLLAAVLATTGLVACGSDDDDGGAVSDDDSGSQAPAENVLEVTENEYAYTFSGEVQAGTVTFAMKNAGKEFHMMAVARFKEGKTLEDLRTAAGSDDDSAMEAVLDEDFTKNNPGNYTFPGNDASLTVPGFPAGHYGVLCFLPTADGTPHFAKGMIGEFEVGAGEAPDPKDADVTIRVTKDGVDGPASLKAGPTTFHIVNSFKAGMEPTIVRIKDGKTTADIDAYFKELDDSEAAPDPTKAPLDVLFGAFDFDDEVWLTVDLTPGKWGLGVDDSDDDSGEELPADKDPFVQLFEVT